MRELIGEQLYFVTGPAPQKRIYDCDIPIIININNRFLIPISCVILILYCLYGPGRASRKILSVVSAVSF